MPTTAGDERFLRWFARLVAFGLVAIIAGRLIDPRERVARHRLRNRHGSVAPGV